VNALVVGGATVRIDDPDLTPREADFSAGGKTSAPEIVVISQRGDFSFREKVFTENRKSRTWLLSPFKPAHLPEYVGHQIIPNLGTASPDLEAPSLVTPLMSFFQERGYHSVWLEGGRSLWGPFLEAKRLDALALWTSPKGLPEGEPWQSPAIRNCLKTFRKFGPFPLEEDSLHWYLPKRNGL
jgi:riboflavin biosynthesis pyrimidine reductase